MKSTLSAIVIIILCTVITSCQKELVDPMVPVVPPPAVTPADSVTRLSKFIYLDPTVSTADTTGYVEFFYDSLQRVILINGYGIFNNATSLIDEFNYYYAGTDSVAYKSDHVEVGTPNNSTSFYFYDNMQRLIKDSVVIFSAYGNSAYTDQYIYGASTIIAINRDSPSGDLISTDTGFIGANGAIIKTVSLETSLGRTVTTSFKYDSNPNPFNQLNIRTTYGPVPGYDEIYVSYLLKNNVVNQTTSDLLFPGSIDKGIFTYTYDTSGMPATVSISDGNGQVNDKVVFLYKKI